MHERFIVVPPFEIANMGKGKKQERQNGKQDILKRRLIGEDVIVIMVVCNAFDLVPDVFPSNEGS